MNKAKLNVLLVDDDAIYQFIACKTLEATGLINNIITCSNGKEAYNFLLSQSANVNCLPDIILLDVNMPVMNGWEFLHTMQSQHLSCLKEIPIFLVTSSTNDADVSYSQQFDNVQDYIVKPLAKDKLMRILSAACVH